MTEKKSPDKKYSKLLGKIDYDHGAVEQLAEALNEITQLETRAAQLKQIVNENEELHQFVWRTQEGVTIPIHKIEDDHLNNIMLYLLHNGRAIPRAIRGEAVSRGLVIPAIVPIDWTDTAAMRRMAAKLERGDVL